MKRLIAFGDSWTAGHGVETDPRYEEIAFGDLFINNLRNANSWPRWTAEKLRIPYSNLGVSGFSNADIVYSLKTNAHLFEPDDLIIIMWSHPYRQEIYDHGKPSSNEELYDGVIELLRDYKFFFVSSFVSMFGNETHLLDKYKHVCIDPHSTMADLLRGYELTKNVSVWEYDKRSVYNDDVRWRGGDYHPNLLGYQVIGEYIYECI